MLSFAIIQTKQFSSRFTKGEILCYFVSYLVQGSHIGEHKDVVKIYFEVPHLLFTCFSSLHFLSVKPFGLSLRMISEVKQWWWYPSLMNFQKYESDELEGVYLWSNHNTSCCYKLPFYLLKGLIDCLILMLNFL